MESTGQVSEVHLAHFKERNLPKKGHFGPLEGSEGQQLYPCTFKGFRGITGSRPPLEVAVAVDDFQRAVADVSQFQRNVLSVVKASAKYGLPGYQGRHLNTQSTGCAVRSRTIFGLL